MRDKETRLEYLLADLRTRLLVMSAAVGIALDQSCAALEHGDARVAVSVVDGDAAINAMENGIDELALTILARNQPVAQDLRFIIGALRMVVDLERIGDEAAAVAERTLTMGASLPPDVMASIAPFMRSSTSLYARAVDAFRAADNDAALDIRRADDELARQEMNALRGVMEHAGTGPEERRTERQYQSMNGILICRSLNRICRRCANIAEHTYFIVEGVNIKHTTPA